jgi:deoxyribose-phosphate aldolase
MIDHTLLKADANALEIEKLCKEAATSGFATVCVNSVWLSKCSELLRGSKTRAITVVGFPLGASTSATKAFEAAEAVRNGASEIDMVLAIGLLKSGDLTAVENDIRTVVEAVRGTPVKVILETALLNEQQKVTACQLAQRAGAAFVKTSTGFASGSGATGATVEDIRLMRATVGPTLGVKASGGIRTREDALRLIEAGATRLGTSAGLTLIAEPGGSPTGAGTSSY